MNARTPWCLWRDGLLGPLRAFLRLWGEMTTGCGRMPGREELEGELAEACYAHAASRSLLPGARYFAFAAVR